MFECFTCCPLWPRPNIWDVPHPCSLTPKRRQADTVYTRFWTWTQWFRKFNIAVWFVSRHYSQTTVRPVRRFIIAQLMLVKVSKVSLTSLSSLQNYSIYNQIKREREYLPCFCFFSPHITVFFSFILFFFCHFHTFITVEYNIVKKSKIRSLVISSASYLLTAWALLNSKTHNTVEIIIIQKRKTPSAKPESVTYPATVQYSSDLWKNSIHPDSPCVFVNRRVLNFCLEKVAWWRLTYMVSYWWFLELQHTA